jgi:hypothetical protein
VLRPKRIEWLQAGLRIARRPPRGLVLALVFLAVEGVYLFILSAGKLTDWPTYLSFLNDQAEGFRSGHLHMAVEPAAALLAKANPSDGANRDLWYWDASLYKGHYFTYWGPIPALLLAAVKVLFRLKVSVGDQVPVFALATLQLLAGTLLIERTARRLFAGLPTALVAMGVLAFGLANPTLYNLARAGVYEAAIVGGHAFLLGGLLFAFEAVWKASSGNATRRDLLGAGACWALALGCRVAVAPAVLLLMFLTALLAAGNGDQRWQRRLAALLAVGAPVAIGVGALLLYNHARFDAWLDFGRHYQLSWIPFTAKLAYVPANLYSYALRPLLRSCRFPFLFAVEDMGPRAFPSWLRPAPGYVVYEQVTGFLVAVPWSWLWIVVVVVQVRAGWRLWRSGAACDPQTRTMGLASIGCAIVALSTLLVALPILEATMRYLGDEVGGLAIGATLGAWLLYQQFRQRVALRRLVIAGCVGLMLATASIGVALGFEGQYKHFRQFNPGLLDKLEARWSVCRHR